jgi:pimeloyl-ACP methyl ester carboxylesterase
LSSAIGLDPLHATGIAGGPLAWPTGAAYGQPPIAAATREEAVMPDEVVPFELSVAASELDELRQRLRRTRWPERETVNDWSQGIPLAYVQDVCRYWAERYDWRATETRLNAIPQFRTELDGLGIHFLHLRSPEPDALPLLLTHGWPGSVVEFLKVLGPLSDPVAHGGDAGDAFHVVCPSLPGYGWSDKPAAPGWGVERIGRAWAELMRRLGYGRYGAQGGDWGAAVTTAIGRVDTSRCAGIHLNMVLAGADPETMDDLTPRERDAIAAREAYDQWDSGYSRQQSTRPQTIGYGLVDSPAAQAAWILEKFWAWTDCDGDPESVLSRDELLDNVMFYWLPAAGASSARLYWESFRGRRGEPVTVPMGASIFPKEIFRPSRRWAAKHYADIRYWNELDRGGHFAAFEQPAQFVEEVRASFRLVR